MFFDDGWLLWILLPLYVVWVILWAALPALRKRFGERGDGALRFSSIKNLQRLRTSPRIPLRRTVSGLRILTLLLLVIAMARPQTGHTQTTVRAEGIDIVLVLDVSSSMLAEDLEPNRIEAAKQVAAEFVGVARTTASGW